MGNVADIVKIMRNSNATFKLESTLDNIKRGARKEVFRIETGTRDYSLVSAWCIHQVGRYGWSLTTTPGSFDNFVIIIYNNADVNYEDLKLIATMRWS